MQTTPLLDSGLINDQLVPIYPNSVMNPIALPPRNPGAGAGTTTLPGSFLSGSAVSVAQPQASAPSGTPMNTQSTTTNTDTILGIPSVAFWVLIAALIAYPILKIVHFHSVVEADTSV